MEAKFFDSLYGGDSCKGIKLCMGIAEGDFWARSAGAQLLYKGENIDDADFEHLEGAANIGEDFVVSAGQANTRFFYIVRRANCCGAEEKTLNAAVKVEFDSHGSLIEQGCNKIINVSAHQVGTDKISLRWFYQTINQVKRIGGFAVFSDNGSGIIDFQNPAGTVEYTGRKFYQFVTGSLSGNHYRFCIRATAGDDLSGEFKDEIRIAVSRQRPERVELICQIL